MSQQIIPKKDYLLLTEQPLAGSSFLNLLRVLKENKFDIDLPFLPRALYVTLMSLSMAPFRAYERYKFHNNVKKIQPANPLFIIGHWRSGTTFLHYLMGQDKSLSFVSTLETMAPNLFLAFESLVKKILEKDLPDKRPMDNLVMHVGLPYEEEYAVANMIPYSFYHGWYFPQNMYTYFKKYGLFINSNKTTVEQWKRTYVFLLKKITYKYSAKRILLKSLVNTARIKHLLDIFPDAQFIHLYRHPIKVYLSTWKLYKKILPLFSFQNIDINKLDGYIIDIYKDLYNQYFMEKHLIPSDNLIELRYEDFVQNPIETLSMVYSHLKLDGFTKAKPFLLKYVKKHFDYRPDTYAVTDSIKDKIFREWEFAFKKFGYTIDEIL